MEALSATPTNETPEVLENQLGIDEAKLREAVLELSKDTDTLGELFEKFGLTEEEAVELQQQYGLSGTDWLDMLTFKSRDSAIQMVFMYVLMITAVIASFAMTDAFIVEKGCTPPEFLASSLGVFAVITLMSFGSFLAFNILRDLKKRKKIK
ncbi:MAG TPA: hypothetical protein PKJ26_01285 [Candidatus Woesebacteria bacterium]|nr:hypothetical protein [Candidatus Woesebacteria bacterium]HNS65108.1 hypothetical protein [Candidatus Woesebacteria bacterium]